MPEMPSSSSQISTIFRSVSSDGARYDVASAGRAWLSESRAGWLSGSQSFATTPTSRLAEREVEHEL